MLENGKQLSAEHKAAIAAGADGLLIEVHPNPELAYSDGEQSLTFDQFTKLVPPCNLMLSVAKKDKWSQDALKIYRFAKPFFKKSELKIKFWPGKHSFKKKMRNEAYNFLVEKLK